MGIPEVTALPPSASKKRAYEALERRFGSNPQPSAPQESKAKKSKVSGSRSRRRNVAREAGRRSHRDQLDTDFSPAKDHHHLNHDGVTNMDPSQALHQDLNGITDEAKLFEAPNSGTWKRDVARDAGEGHPNDPDVEPSPAKKKISTIAPFWRNTTLGVSGISDDNSRRLKHPAYFGLSMTLDEKLIKIGEKDVGNGVGYAKKFMHDLLLNGDCSQKYVKGTQNMKFDDWFLLDNLTPKVSSTNELAKSLQSHSRRFKNHMSMKQHRKCGSFDLPQEFHSFDLFKPMHEMWKDYIAKLLQDTRRNQMSSHLLTADLHGSMLLVVECTITAFTGIKGVMVRETTETFGVVTEKNKFRVVPKRGSVFIFQAGSWKITLIGDELSSRIIGK